MPDDRWIPHVLLLEPPVGKHRYGNYENLPPQEDVRRELKTYGRIIGLHSHHFKSGWKAAFITFYEPASLKLFLSEHPFNSSIRFLPDRREYRVLPLDRNRQPQYAPPCDYDDIDRIAPGLGQPVVVDGRTHSPRHSPIHITPPSTPFKASDSPLEPGEVPGLPRRPPSPIPPLPPKPATSAPSAPRAMLRNSRADASHSSPASSMDAMKMAENTSLRDEMASLRSKIAVEEERVRRQKEEQAKKSASSSSSAAVGPSRDDELVRSLEANARAERMMRQRLEDEEHQLRRELDEIEERYEHELERIDELERKLRRVQRQTRWRNTTTKKDGADSPLIATLNAMEVDEEDATASARTHRAQIEALMTDLAELKIQLDTEEGKKQERVVELKKLRSIVAGSSETPETDLALAPVHLRLLDAFDARVRRVPRTGQS